jgi:hypothetical protein
MGSMKKAFLLFSVVLLLVAGSALANSYDTYAGNAGLVSTAQMEQARHQLRDELTFRNMSIADRWDASSSGSIVARWNPSSFGSIEQRWTK